MMRCPRLAAPAAFTPAVAFTPAPVACAGVVAHASGAPPGPGSYNPPAGGDDSGIRRRMPQFADSSHDRFGKPVTGGHSLQTPGPGAYLRDDERQTAVISSSVFMSGTSRGAGAKEAIPGPAYYSPAPNAKKSYHLNARQRWVPSL